MGVVGQAEIRDEHTQGSVESCQHSDAFSYIYITVELMTSLRTSVEVEDRSQDRVPGTVAFRSGERKI